MRPGLGMFLFGLALLAACVGVALYTEHGGIVVGNTVIVWWGAIPIGLWYAIKGVVLLSRGSG